MLSVVPPTVDVRHVPELLSAWRPVTVEEVASILKESAAKQCELDPLTTWLVKRASVVLAPVIVRICNAPDEAPQSQQNGHCPTVAEEAHTGPERPGIIPPDL